MRVPRIHLPQPLQPGAEVQLDAPAGLHVAKVLRLRAGAPLLLFNGEGGEFEAEISDIRRNEVWVKLGTRIERELESPLRITLVQGISKGERMDYTIQKAVELGVQRIIPVMTARTVVNLKGERQDKRLSHWQGIARSACEQCGRNRLPEVAPITDLARWFAHDTKGLKLMLDHRGAVGVNSLEPVSGLTLVAGPEGGFTAKERELGCAAGYLALRLGPRVLRTETAALTALAVLQSRWGDLG